VALTPHGDWVLSGSKDRGVQFWDPHTGVAQLMLQGHKNSGTFYCTCAQSQTAVVAFTISGADKLTPVQLSLSPPARREASSLQAAATCVLAFGSKQSPFPTPPTPPHLQPCKMRKSCHMMHVAIVLRDERWP